MLKVLDNDSADNEATQHEPAARTLDLTAGTASGPTT